MRFGGWEIGTNGESEGGRMGGRVEVWEGGWKAREVWREGGWNDRREAVKMGWSDGGRVGRMDV